MKNLFRNIFLVSCLLLTVGAVEAQAQTVQKQIDPSLQTQMAELKAKMQKLEPNSSSYKATKAEYDRLLNKESESQKAEAPQVAKPATIAPQKTAMPPVKVDGKLAKGTAKPNRVAKAKSTPTPTTRRDVNTVTTTKKVVKGTGNVTGSPIRSLNPSKR